MDKNLFLVSIFVVRESFLFFFSFIKKYKKTNNKNKNLFHFTFLNYFFRPCIYAVGLIILGSCGGGGGGGGGNSSCSEFLLPQSQNK